MSLFVQLGGKPAVEQLKYNRQRWVSYFDDVLKENPSATSGSGVYVVESLRKITTPLREIRITYLQFVIFH